MANDQESAPATEITDAPVEVDPQEPPEEPPEITPFPEHEVQEAVEKIQDAVMQAHAPPGTPGMSDLKERARRQESEQESVPATEKTPR